MAKKSWIGGLHKPSKRRKSLSYAPYNYANHGPTHHPPTDPLSDDVKKTTFGYAMFHEMGSPPRRKKG